MPSDAHPKDECYKHLERRELDWRRKLVAPRVAMCGVRDVSFSCLFAEADGS